MFKGDEHQVAIQVNDGLIMQHAWLQQEMTRMTNELATAKARLKAAEHEVTLRGHTINKLANRVGRQRAEHRRYRDAVCQAFELMMEKIRTEGVPMTSAVPEFEATTKHLARRKQ
jgi:hypothetical protein